MSTLLEQASLVFIPSGYKEGKAYSIIPSNGDGDLSFGRTTEATRINSDGLIETMPWNLASYSEQFDNGAWTKSNSTVVANVITAPDGTLTADSFSQTATTTQHLVNQPKQYVAGYNYTASVYAKAGNQGTLVIVMSFTGFGANWRTAYFDLINGVVTYNNNNSGIAPTITSVGNGWYRCTFTNTCTTSTNDTFAFGKDFYSNLGDGQVNLYLWGAQLVLGSTAKTYFRTTNRQNIPRLDYSTSNCPSLLLEPQRTNWCLNSEGTGIYNYTANVTISNVTDVLNPMGLYKAVKVVATNVYNYAAGSSQISKAFPTNTVISMMAYVKPSGVNSITMGDVLENGTARFSLVGNGAVISNGVNTISSSIKLVQNGFYEIKLTYTFKNPVGNGFLYAGFSGFSNYDGVSAVYISGLQIEDTSSSSSYIQTFGSAVTRTKDIVDLTNLQTKNILSSNWSIYSEFIDYGNSNNYETFILGLKNVSSSDWIGFYRNFYGIRFSKKENNGTVSVTDSSIQVANGNTIKIVIKCESNNIKSYINGTLAYTSTFANPSLMTMLELGRMMDVNNSTVVKSVLAFNIALTNTECISLTTL